MATKAAAKSKARMSSPKNSASTEQPKDRIRSRRKLLGFSLQALARRIPLKHYQTIIHWENGVSLPNGKNMTGLCEALDVTQDWILYGKNGTRPLDAESKTSDTAVYLPVIPATVAVKDISMEARKSTTKRKAALPGGPNRIYMEVTDNSMFGLVDKGGYVIIDMDAPHSIGNVVAVKPTARAKTIIRKLVRTGSKKQLLPLNSDYPALDVTDSTQFVGRVVSVLFDLP